MKNNDRPDKKDTTAWRGKPSHESSGALRAVLDATSRVTGRDYLRTLVVALSESLGLKYVFVGELFERNGRWARTVALCVDGKLVENIEYPLEGTPCWNVVGQTICFYPKGVCKLFPEDKLLAQMGVESYLGVPLFDLSGGSIGIISCLHDDAMLVEPDLRMILSRIAPRVAIALERMIIEDERLQIGGRPANETPGHVEAPAPEAGEGAGLREEDSFYGLSAHTHPLVKGGLFSRLAESTQDQIFIVDRGLCLRYGNEAWGRFTGKGMGELSGKPLAEIFPEEVFRVMRENLVSVFTTGVSLYKEERFLMPGRGEVWLGTRLTPVKAGEGGLTSVIGVSRDITRQMRLVRELKTQRDAAQKYLDIAGVIIVILDRGGNVAVINKKGCEELGCDEAEILGRNWFDEFIPPSDRERVKGVFGALMAGDITLNGAYENRILTKDGRERIVEWRNTVLTDDAGNIRATLSSGSDITELRAREEERERLIAELQGANANVKILSGLLPICASCKRIRASDGEWQRLERYIEAHSNAGFTHGLCPECAKKIML